MQPGDVPDTYADVDQLIKDVNYRPETRFRMASSGLLRGTGSITGLMGGGFGLFINLTSNLYLSGQRWYKVHLTC